MKNFTTKAVAVAVGVICAGVAHAGSFTAPAANINATRYAIEALTGTTAVQLPQITYTMGVSRPIGTSFTIILTPSTGATFAATCPVLTPGAVGGSTVVASIKRQSATECAYDLAISVAASPANMTLSWPAPTAGVPGVWTAPTLVTSGLNVPGTSVSVIANLWDQGETARIDNSGPVSRTVATSLQAINIYAASSDTSTVVDVNATTGPLTGFVAGGPAPADIATRAAANLVFDNNFQAAAVPDGITPFDFVATAGTATVVLTGVATGAAANGFYLDLNGGVTFTAGEAFTLSPTTATLTGIASSNFPATGTTATRTTYFISDTSTQLGTSRTFALTGMISPTVGSANALLNSQTGLATPVAAFNPTWWVWSANASQLMTPYFTTDARWLTRYFLLNTGSTAVSYSATCFGETSNVITYGTARNGSLSAAGMTAINARDVCTFSGNTRGSVLFTINAPVSAVKGSYQFVDPITLSGNVVPMTRPYGTSPTE